jgi:hypothetical protein
MPVTVFEFHRSYLFGLFQFWIITQDRKPPPGSSYKYKTQMKLKFFWFNFSYIVNSFTPGVFFYDDLELQVKEPENDLVHFLAD